MYININNTDLKPFPIALGTAIYGSGISKEDSNMLLSTYFEYGGNLIDTASVYGNSETVIGKWLENINREKITLMTKGAHPNFAIMDRRLNEKEILKDLEESLTALKTDYIDVYYLHRDDPNVEVSEIINILEKIKKSGKIRYYACSNFKTDRIISANDYAAKNNMEGFIMSQVMFNAAKVNGNPAGIDSIEVDKNMYQMHKESNLCLVAYSSVASGFFALAMNDDFFTNDKFCGVRDKYINATTKSILDTIKEYSRKYNIDTNTLALLYVMNQPFPSIPIIGPRNKKELLSCLDATKVTKIEGLYPLITKLKEFEK